MHFSAHTYMVLIAKAGCGFKVESGMLERQEFKLRNNELENNLFSGTAHVTYGKSTGQSTERRVML